MARRITNTQTIHKRVVAAADDCYMRASIQERKGNVEEARCLREAAKALEAASKLTQKALMHNGSRT